MSTEINLLPHKSLSVFSHERMLVYTKVVAIVALIITVCLSILVFLINRDPTLQELDSQQKTLLTQLSVLHTKTAKDLIILDRLKRIQSLIKSRGSVDVTIAQINDQVPDGASVTEFALDNKTLTLSLTSSSLIPMGQFIDNMTKLVSSKKVVKQITIQGLITDEKGGKYTMTVNGILL